MKRASAMLILWAALVIALPAQTFTFTVLHSFCIQLGCTGGEDPIAALLQASNGKLYSTTSSGGIDFVGGTVFEITTGGTFKELYSFCSQPECTDGNRAYRALVQAPDDYLFGVTMYGGTNCPDGGCGTVFKTSPAGAFTNVYDFCSLSNCADGDGPNGALILNNENKMYGTTEFGGSYGGGTVFRITETGNLETLYSFCALSACQDGTEPVGALVLGPDGAFYGTTALGGAHNLGTVFTIRPSGPLTTLHSFAGADGNDPVGALLPATNGYFYGTTVYGGAYNMGEVFQMTADGTLTPLYSFCGCGDGQYPSAGLVQATDGNLYGTTAGQGETPGTLFRISLGGDFTSLYTFCSQPNCADGISPQAALIQDTNGLLYGTAEGNDANSGTIFSVSLGLGPFVKTLPGFGPLGAKVEILGTDLTGATSVTFNGTPAVFSVVQSSEIETTVPIGATSGKVEVVTPGGTLASNVAFRVD